jgi:hypothetical protein
MKSTVSSYDFHRAFERARPDNFSYEGLNVLFDYLESLEDDTGEEIELDVIALCCDYSEDSAESIASSCGIDLSDCEDDEEKSEAVRSYLERNTSICGETPTGFVYASNF